MADENTGLVANIKHTAGDAAESIREKVDEVVETLGDAVEAFGDGVADAKRASKD